MGLDRLASLGERLHPQAVITGVTGAVGAMLPFERVGIAMLNNDRRAFRVVAVADREGGTVRSGYCFEAAQTAGAWAVRHRVPFRGDHIDDLRDVPGTLESMVRDGFVSNLVVPLELGAWGESGVMFMLSRRRRAFTVPAISLCLRVRDIVEPAARAYLAASDLCDGGAVLDPPEPGVLPPSDPGLTLVEVERRHIEAVLRDSHGVIEGPRGAARRLGLRPSTLRAKMKKLGAQRHPG